MLSNLYSQNISDGELMIVNRTGNSGYNIIIHVHPYGSVFNGNNEYTLKAANPIPPDRNKLCDYYYLLSKYQTGSMWYVIANFDKTFEYTNCIFPLGYTKYRIDFMNENLQMIDYCYIDFNDADYGTLSFSGYQKIRFDYYASDNIQFNFIGDGATPLLINDPLVHRDVKVWEQIGTPNPSHFPNKGDFIDYSENGNEYHDYPIDARRIFGNNYWHEEPEKINLNLKLHNYDAQLHTDCTLNINECIFNIDDGKIFTVNGSYFNQMIISGLGAKFKSGNNSKLFFPADYQLIINNNAMLESNGTKFQVGEGLPIWKGIYLENCGGAFFQDCEFKYAKKSIFSTNYGINFLNINHNNFTIPENYDPDPFNAVYGIETWKCNNISINNNSFYYPSDPCQYNAGVAIYRNANSEEENNDAPWIRINVVNNYFYGGNSQLTVDALSEQYFSPYISNNHFYDGKNNISLLYTYGKVSNNEIINDNYYGCGDYFCNISLYKNNSDFYNNYNILGKYDNFYLDISCYPNFAPLIFPDGSLFWKGGKNIIHSTSCRNFWGPTSDYPGYIYTDNGKNLLILT